MLFYLAVFTQGERYITVTFPDIPSTITQGKTQEEALEMAQEVLGFALEDYEKYPKASDIVELQKQHPESTIAVIGIDMAAYNRKYHSKKAPLCSKKLSKKCLNCYDYLVPNRRSPASPKPGTI